MVFPIRDTALQVRGRVSKVFQQNGCGQAPVPRGAVADDLPAFVFFQFPRPRAQLMQRDVDRAVDPVAGALRVGPYVQEYGTPRKVSRVHVGNGPAPDPPPQMDDEEQPENDEKEYLDGFQRCSVLSSLSRRRHRSTRRQRERKVRYHCPPAWRGRTRAAWPSLSRNPGRRCLRQPLFPCGIRRIPSNNPGNGNRKSA